MTSLFSPPRPTAADHPARRPLTLVAVLGGLLAAGGPLLVAMAVGVVGWFVTDAGAHGTSSDGLRVGTLIWLVAHGSGLQVSGVPITAVPLGVTALCGWVVWRLALRVGDAVSGHGPDADGISDGERDWTVPTASALFTATYAVLAVVAGTLASRTDTAPDLGRVVLWCLALGFFVATPAIAIGSGRAAIWVSFLPVWLRASLTTAAVIVAGFLGVAALTVAAALAADFGEAASVLSRLHTDTAESALLTLATAAMLPNAALFAGAWLLGPGFAVGTGTLVSPTLVVLGPVPAFPLLAALPVDDPPAWMPWSGAVPFIVAAVAAARSQRRHPTASWDEGALRGLIGGVVAGAVWAALSLLAGGAVGPGRMRVVEPEAFGVLVHAIAAFGIGGMVGGVAMALWCRRRLART